MTKTHENDILNDVQHMKISQIFRFAKSKPWYTAVIVVLLIVGGGIVYGQFAKQQANIEYTTALVTKGDIEQTVSATGTLQGSTEVNLNFTVCLSSKKQATYSIALL